MFRGWHCFYPHKSEQLFQIFLEPKYGYPHNAQDILLFRLMLYATILGLGAMYAIILFIDLFFLRQKYAVNLLEICLFETGEESFSGDCIYGCCFVCSGISRLCRCMSLLIMMIFS